MAVSEVTTFITVSIKYGVDYLERAGRWHHEGHFVHNIKLTNIFDVKIVNEESYVLFLILLPLIIDRISDLYIVGNWH